MASVVSLVLVSLVMLIVIAVFAYVVIKPFLKSHFSMPDSRPPAPCPPGSERGKNGLDCKSFGDRYGF